MRLPLWETKLNDYISYHQFKGFEYGKHDCCSFTIEAQKILTGSTLFPEFDGTYKDLKGGKAILKKLGYKTWIGACNDRLEKIIVPLAKRGDVVSMRTNDSFAMGLCMGKYGAFVGKEKMEYIPREQLKLAWRID
jgi:hypothetical protein